MYNACGVLEDANMTSTKTRSGLLVYFPVSGFRYAFLQPIVFGICL